MVNLMISRNKNKHKTIIDYDVNVYVRDNYDLESKISWQNPNEWYLHVYDYNDGQQEEVSRPFLLTKEEAFAMNFLDHDDIDDGMDGWMSMDHLMTEYKDVMSDRIREYLEGFPKYKEDVILRTVYN
jgi:hypothetical protein